VSPITMTMIGGAGDLLTAEVTPSSRDFYTLITAARPAKLCLEKALPRAWNERSEIRSQSLDPG
jgi:hypothetical protein